MSCFYISALIIDSRACQVSCVKTIWYLVVLNTSLQIVNVLNRAGAVLRLGNHEVVDTRIFFFWHRSKKLCMLFVLIQVVKVGSLVILSYKVVSISNLCKKIIQKYTMFWYAVELQAYLFIIFFGIAALLFIFFGCFLMGMGAVVFNFDQTSDVENPEPVPINHGTEMAPRAETSELRKSKVKKASVDYKACSICRENEKTYACIPCGHMCLCAICVEDFSKKGVKGQNITRCPICRLEVDNFSRIYQ